MLFVSASAQGGPPDSVESPHKFIEPERSNMIIMFTVFSIALAVLDAHAASGSSLLVPLVAPVDPSGGMMLMVPPEEKAFPEPPFEVLPPF